MMEDEERAVDDILPAAVNDNGNRKARPRIDAAALRIARLIGRQMAREEFERLRAEAATITGPPVTLPAI